MHAAGKLVALFGLALAATASAQEQIPWQADFKQACDLAASQKRLVLLHFYGDNCPPCERVEQLVFSQASVATAITKNYVPVKVHVSKSPDLAARYQVNRWPTDVICTPAGLEVTRAISPQSPEAYVAMVDQVALQTGVGASRQWSSPLTGAAADLQGQGAAAAQAFATRVGASTAGYANQAGATVNQYATQAGNYANQANTAAQGYAAQVQGYAGQAQQQLAQANQQYQQASDQAQAAAGQVHQQVADTSKQFQVAGEQVQGTAQQAATDLRSAWNSAATNLRSAWTGEAPADPAASPQPGGPYGPTTTAPPTAAQAPPIGTVPAGGYVVNPAIAPAAPQAAPGPAPQMIAGIAPPAQQSPAAGNSASWAPPATQVVANPAPQAPPAVAPPADQQTLVPASQAPPTAMDGYCTVSLVEGMKWAKGDPRFGAIHHGQTYLFATAAEQQKFLADPDRYCPVLDGFDPVRFAKSGELVPGKRSCGLTYKKQIYLFADEASLQQFAKSSESFSTVAHQAMLQRETTGAYR